MDTIARHDMNCADWLAPSLDAFEVMAQDAYDRLPQAFRDLCSGHDLCSGVVIHVVDFPDDETMAEMECESPFDLLGLFHGIGLAQDGAFPETGRMPNVIWLYRRPILDYWAEHEETLGSIVTHVLVHEIGHHFGLSDEDMEAIEARAG
jgi:predicted Zn-dependent protease with MMP-like domain